MGSAVHSASVASSLRNLGTRAVSRHCDFAVQFANRVFAAPGIGVVSKPIINQLILNFGFGDNADRKQQTEAVIERVVADGTCYVAGALWRGDWVMRVSISSAATTELDIDLSADAIIQA